MVEPGESEKDVFKKITTGYSASKIYKILSLQRLNPEILEMEKKGVLPSDITFCLTRVSDHTRQKILADIILQHRLPRYWASELTKLISMAENEKDPQFANALWDFFFEIKTKLDTSGASDALLGQLVEFLRHKKQEKTKKVIFETFQRPITNLKLHNLLPDKGIDCGTTNIKVCARRVNGEIISNIQRNAFLELKLNPFTEMMLSKLNIEGINKGSAVYILGDAAFSMANIFDKDIKRTMISGVLNPDESDGLEILSNLLSKLAGRAQVENETCVFSVYSPTLDEETNTVYHKGMIELLIRYLGYNPVSIEKGFAVVLSELKSEEYTGVGISCGGGGFNVCISYKGLPAVTFSITRGGDWIDRNVARSVGITPTQACAIKESQMDISRPLGKIQEAIAIHYRYLIKYILDNIRTKFESLKTSITIPRPIQIVCAGATSLIGGFEKVWKEELIKAELPFNISDVRMASDPILAVAKGCLLYSRGIS